MLFKLAKYSFVILLFICGIKTHAQPAEYKSLTDDIEKLSTKFDHINPFEEWASLKNYGYTYKDFPSVDAENFSANKDSIIGSTLKDLLQERILEKIDRLVRLKGFKQYGLPKHTNISITHSADKKLYNFTFEENTGGSYHSRVSVLYYIPGDNSKIFRVDPEDPDGYNNIYELKSKTGTKYLLQGFVMGCNSCWGSYIRLLHFENGKAITDFNYYLSCRASSFDDDSDLVIYNEKLQTITIHYYTDDLATFCKCGEGEAYGNDENLPVIHKCYCYYRFNGNTFILADSSDEITKPRYED